MGGYTTYEVDMAEFVDWDDSDVETAMEPYMCDWLYLRDEDTMRIIFSVYSNSDIKHIIKSLKTLYPVGMKYRMYGNKNWRNSTA